ncbi:MAG: hypothetical protein QOJ99_4260 [Bryobacterales bacterium]|nr:hypothetical protein [Bryobacterales bacterium]
MNDGVQFDAAQSWNHVGIGVKCVQVKEVAVHSAGRLWASIAGFAISIDALARAVRQFGGLRLMLA